MTPGRPERLTPTQEIALTVAGALATDKASEELSCSAAPSGLPPS
ncbi:hypothetical protein [Plantactinospora soyae]|uniref:Uncharacterized protein n=1 Tax=Plantactinospora soyae TaxID=1544732 RepID=A0A927MH11_9ACTN|nr:hypothetical protein [Plantactinospora soyae]MBE1490990.1 hypothetical protein [Plantactinospora soyae]